MPAIVDHDARRNEVAEVAARLLARAGPEKVTVRDIADASGYSTTVVSHYFRGKSQLLFFTHRAMALRLRKRVEDAVESDRLQNVLEAMLPLDDESQTEWKVYLAFWSRIHSDPDYESEQQPYTIYSHELLDRALTRWRKAGYLKAGIDCRAESDRLITFVVGIGTQWAYDPKSWPPERQRAFVARELEALRRTTRIKVSN